MKLKVMIGCILFAVILSAGIVLWAQGDEGDPLLMVMDKSDYTACGIERLTIDERQRLFDVLTGDFTQSFLEEAAINVLQNDGWSKIYVVDAAIFDNPGEKYLVIIHQYEQYILDPIIIPYLPDPGIYWAKNSGSVWSILYPDGKTHDFWTKDL